MKQKTLFHTFSKLVTLNILGMLGLSCYILADTFFVAKGLGTNGLASLNLAISIYSFIHATGLMIGIGGATKYTILKAQNKREDANEIFSHSLFFGIIVGLIFVLVGIVGSEALSRFLGANAETFEMSNTYIKTILCFSPFFILNNILIAFIRNDYAPKLAMGGMLIGSVSNIILDYVFIFPLNLGMFGAAFATGLAPIISMILLSFHFIGDKSDLHIRKYTANVKTLGNIISLGVSSFITEISSGIVLIVFNKVILRLAGNTGVAAYGIIANLSLIAVAIFVGIAQGMQPLVSSSYGLKKHGQLMQLLKYAVVLSLILSVIIYILVNIFSDGIISIFNSENNRALADYAAKGIFLYFIGFIFAGVNIILISYLSASQKAKFSFVISIVRGFLVIIPLVILLSLFFGINGVWLAFTFTEGITIIFILVRLKNIHLKSINI